MKRARNSKHAPKSCPGQQSILEPLQEAKNPSAHLSVVLQAITPHPCCFCRSSHLPARSLLVAPDVVLECRVAFTLSLYPADAHAQSVNVGPATHGIGSHIHVPDSAILQRTKILLLRSKASNETEYCPALKDVLH